MGDIEVYAVERSHVALAFKLLADSPESYGLSMAGWKIGGSLRRSPINGYMFHVATLLPTRPAAEHPAKADNHPMLEGSRYLKDTSSECWTREFSPTPAL